MTKEKILEILNNKTNFIRVHTQLDGKTITLFDGDCALNVKPEEFSMLESKLKIVKNNYIELPFMGAIRDTEYKLK